MQHSQASDWTSFTIPISGGIIAAKEKGNGTNLLICLHGFGENQHAFDSLLDDIPIDWCVCSLDLPLFGESKWENTDISIQDHTWKQVSSYIRLRHPEATWHLLGYSMGGKVALKLQELLEVPAKTVLLFAPDGLRRQPLHAFATGTVIGKWLFRQLMIHPRIILTLNQVAYRLGLIDRFLFRFVQGNFSEKKWRDRIFYTMTLYEGFQVNWERLAQQAQIHPTHWSLVWGKYDPTFSQTSADRLLRSIPSAKETVLDTGHLLLRDRADAILIVLEQELFERSID